MQAVEAIKIITGLGEVLSGRMLLYDALRASFQTFRFAARPDSRNFRQLTRRLWNHLRFTDPGGAWKKLTLKNWKEFYNNLRHLCLSMCANPNEFERFNVGGINWPLRTLPQRLSELQSHTMWFFAASRAFAAAKLMKYFPPHCPPTVSGT